MSQSSKNHETLQEYGRGIIGGLLFSLPLIYTMEVWWTGFIAPPAYQICCIFFTFLLLLGFNTFAGMRKDSNFREILWDSVEEIGLAFIVSFLFLLLIRRIGFGMSLDEMAGKVIVESMIVAIGISVGTAQLGNEESSEDSGSSAEGKEIPAGPGYDIWQIIVLSACGAVLFASSVAPTQEILMIAVESTNIHLLFMVILSLLLNFIILHFSNFKGSSGKKKSFKKMSLYVLITYIVALIISFFFLWFFGRVDGFSFYVILSQIIVLAIPGTIGAAAGRLLLAH